MAPFENVETDTIIIMELQIKNMIFNHRDHKDTTKPKMTHKKILGDIAKNENAYENSLDALSHNMVELKIVGF